MDKLQPIAWMQVHYKDGRPTKFSKVQTWEDDIPLYTHPAKTLTNEEIIEVWGDQIITETEKDAAIPFARAILKKAQK